MKIPDIDIIDLDTAEETPDEFDDDLKAKEELLNSMTDLRPNKKKKKGFSFFAGMHIILLVTMVAFVAIIVLKFSTWGQRVDLDEIFKDGQGTYDNSLDEILPLITDSEAVDDGETTIVCFGNAPFADDRDSEDNLANMIADATGATVYNCSVGGSYLAAQWPHFSANDMPMDAYNFYWLVTLATGGGNNHYYSEAAERLGEATPPEAQEVYDTLTTLDFSKVDVITIMYDATDYLMGHEMYSDQNATDIQQFTGNLEAGISLLQAVYPHIRIIVMSPTYAFAVDEEGNYVSSDIYTYGQDVLSTYVIKQYGSSVTRSVTFVDHLYGTITEDNAQEYLIDNLHLNVEGRKKVTERFKYALEYYDD